MARPCGKCGADKVKRKCGRWRCRPCDRAYQRRAYAKHPDVLRERKRDHMARLRGDPETREQLNARRRGNPKYAAGNKAYARNLRSRHFFRWRARNRGMGITAEMLASLWKRQRGRCALSGRKLGRDAHLDHIVPVSQGGGGSIDNLRWTDPWVNVARQDLADADFFERCSQVAEWIGRRLPSSPTSAVEPSVSGSSGPTSSSAPLEAGETT